MTRTFSHLLCVSVLVWLGLLPPPVSSAETVAYQTVTPRVGDPFELAAGFTAIEPVIAGSGDPLPGWVGSGHMILLDDGRLLLAYSSDSVCFLTWSSDGGRTWTPPRQAQAALPENAKTHRIAVTEASNGDLWLFYYGLIKYDRDDAAASINNLWTVQSSDGGETWSEPRQIFQGYVGMLQGAIRTSTGNLVVPLCNFERPRHFIGYCVVSTDGGKTWTTTEPIDIGSPESPYQLAPGLNGGTLEPSVAELPDGRLLMLIRTIQGLLYQSTSSDGGLTWERATPTTLDCGGPCNVVRLPSGRAAVAWNPANPNSKEAQRLGSPIGYDSQTIAVLDDDGVTWRSTRHFTRQIEGKTRVVHSTIVGRPDGELVITMPGRSTLVCVSEKTLLEPRG